MTEKPSAMDVTTVNDRHLYRARVVVHDPGHPAGQLDLPGRIVRFGPSGWLTVVDRTTEGARIALYPTCQVLAVTDLREADVSAPAEPPFVG
jgi:hypothetical protein